MWVDREGASQPTGFEAEEFLLPRLSPDGRRAAVLTLTDLWALDLERGSRRRLTFQAVNPVSTWSPDGDAIVFTSTRTGSPQLFMMPVDGDAEPERVTPFEESVEFPGSWNESGELVFTFLPGPGRASDADVAAVRPGEPATARIVVGGRFNQHGPCLSPDGRWLAYVTDESGRDEVVLRAFPAGEVTWPVSANGGTEPVWSRDGTELYFRIAKKMWTVTVETEPELTVSKPIALFDDPYRKSRGAPDFAMYDVAPDGRFLMSKRDHTAAYDGIRVVLGWQQELKRQVGQH
jgi:Tol biopolymer transport system component